MKAYRKMDKTLKYLIENKDPYGEKSSVIFDKLKIANDALEQHLILEKLADDEYVYKKFDKQNGEEVHKLNPSFVISYHGIVFYENGGYRVEYAIRAREKFNRQLLSFLNPAWKIIAFVAAIGGLVKLYMELFKC